MTEKEKTRVSKFMSLVLRHKPEEIGETLDKDGWMSTTRLLHGLQKQYPNLNLTLDDIRDIVATCEKKRYTLSIGDLRIRASQGHSVMLEGSTVEKATPPDVLYHGTAWANEKSIRAEGLRPISRIHVHLSVDLETAHRVGKRHGWPVVFLVNAKKASEDGIAFYCSDNGVWLCDALSATYLDENPVVLE